MGLWMDSDLAVLAERSAGSNTEGRDMARARMTKRSTFTRRRLIHVSAGSGLVLSGASVFGARPVAAGSTVASVQEAQASPEYTGPSVALDFWNGLTGGDGPFMLGLVEEFNAAHENIEVTMNATPWAEFYQTLPAAVSSGAGPDVVVIHSFQIATNAARQVLLPLDQVATELGLAETDFSPPVWQAGIFNGQRFGIPLDVWPDGLFYNKQVLQQAGLDPNTPPQNGEQYLSALEQLKAAGIQGSWVGAVDTWGGRRFETLLWQFGGDLYNEDVTEAIFNSDAGVQALTWWVDLIRNGYSPENVAGEDIITAFLNNQNAFVWGGPGAYINEFAGTDGLEWGVAPVPLIGSEQAVFAGSHNFALIRQNEENANELQASQVFIKWMSDNSAQWAVAGPVPARLSELESELFQTLEAQQVFAEELPYARFYPVVPGLQDVQAEALYPALSDALLLIKDPKTALDEAASYANELLEENRERYGG